MEFKNIVLQQEDNVSTILINRPPYNVLNVAPYWRCGQGQGVFGFHQTGIEG